MALCSVVAVAVPANREKFTYTQPDGSKIVLQLHGDEFCHWTTDASGQVVERGADGYYRPVSAASHQARLQVGRINRVAANAARRGPRRASVAKGQKHFLVILVQFSNLSFQNDHDQQAFSDLLNEPAYSANGGVGSAQDFFRDNSGGLFVPVFDVYGPVTLSNTQAYYGGNNSSGKDLRPREAVKEACELLDPTVDFSQYDHDGDGEVDLVFMYYAGRGEADGGGDDCIWPHQWNLGNSAPTLDGKKVSAYACTNELTLRQEQTVLCGIGTACHEFSHALGVPDFYDTDYTNVGEEPEAGGLYWYSPMSYGNYLYGGRMPPYFTIEERILLGWLDERALREFPSSGTYTLETVNKNVAYKTLTDKSGEYFVYECRSAKGWDRSLPEKGLIVYHVDKSDHEITLYRSNGTSYTKTAAELWSDWTEDNALNANGLHPCYYVVPAGDPSSLNYPVEHENDGIDGNDYYFAFPGGAKATSFTAVSWSGTSSQVSLSNISYADNTVTFYATVPSATLNYNVIENPGNGIYSAGSSFALNLVESAAQPVSSVAWYFDDEPVSGTSVTLTAGTHVVEAHLTLASGETKILELTLTAQ